MYVQVSGTNKCLAILFVKFVSVNLHFDVPTTKFVALENDAIIRDRAYENQPYEHKLHQVVFSIISFVLNALSHFRKLHKKAH